MVDVPMLRTAEEAKMRLPLRYTLSANGTALVRQMMTDIAWAFGVQNCPRTVEEILVKAKADQILQPPQNVGPDV